MVGICRRNIDSIANSVPGNIQMCCIVALGMTRNSMVKAQFPKIPRGGMSLSGMCPPAAAVSTW